jgi:hypothetical protein
MSTLIRLTLAAAIFAIAPAAAAGDVPTKPAIVRGPKVAPVAVDEPAPSPSPTPAPTVVEGQDADMVAVVRAAVTKQLTKPLAKKEDETSRFSRAAMPAQERRVRVLDAKAQVDESGKAFATFAVDARHGYNFDGEDDSTNPWRKDVITGCVCLEANTVFVKRGDELRPASVLLGKKSKAAPASTCKAKDSTQLAQADG